MIDFDLKTDPNMDLMLTQSREQLATGQLPPSVNSYGVSVKKAVTAPLMINRPLFATRKPMTRAISLTMPTST